MNPQLNKKFAINFLSQFLTGIEKMIPSDENQEIASQKSKNLDKNLVGSNNESSEMTSNTNMNKSANVQPKDKLNFFDKTKKIQFQGKKKLSSPLFNVNKNSAKNGNINNYNPYNNNIVDYVSPKNRPSISKGASNTSKLFSASPMRNRGLENFRASNYNSHTQNTISNLNKPNNNGKTNMFSNRAIENIRSKNKRNSNISSNLSNKNYNNTVSFNLNLNKNDQKINGDISKIDRKNVKTNPDKTSIHATKTNVKSQKRHHKDNNSVDVKTSAAANKNTSNKHSISYKQSNFHSNIIDSVNNRITSIDVNGRKNKLHEVKELLPKKNSKNLFVKNQFYKENFKSINNKHVISKDNDNSNSNNDLLNKKELKENNNQQINNLGLDNFLNEFKIKSNDADMKSMKHFENQSRINNFSNNNIPSKYQNGNEIKNSPANELDPKSYLSFLNANILKINSDNKTEVSSNIDKQSKTENLTTDDNHIVFIKNKYKLLFENYKN